MADGTQGGAASGVQSDTTAVVSAGAGGAALDPATVHVPADAIDRLASVVHEAANLVRHDSEILERSAQLKELEADAGGQRQRLEVLQAASREQAADIERLDVPARKAVDTRARRDSFSVADVGKGEEDREGREIEEVFARKAGSYAVYRVKDGDVWAQMADSSEVADRQRVALGKISIFRWDIDRLADGWKREAHYHRELAAGLQLALSLDEQGAQDKLTRVLDGLRQERAIAGRVQYMFLSSCLAAILLCALYVFSELIYPFSTPATNVWLAAKGGLVGAFLSIAISIRGRTVALDNDWKSNAMEGAVRLSIGVIAGGFLLLALGSGFLARVVAGDVNGVGQISTWQAAVTLGFLGGFVERLVPSLLDKAQMQTAAQGAAQGAAPGQQKAA